MRVNIYAEEMTGIITVVRKTADTGLSFIGLRFTLKGSDDLHDTPDDDDRPAVTFWFPDTINGLRTMDVLASAVYSETDRARGGRS